MKLYKSYILAGLIALGFTACDTDDLERDINALKDRVENYEAQVQKLNDDMNIIRVLLDGNKTISEWSYDGSTYTLKLSNGETLTLTDGVIGTNYPSIEIGDNGNWIIAGKDSGIRAVAEDGDDATFTPQFKIEDGNWCVSHDNGQTWSNLGVSATGTPTEATSPIKDIDTEKDPNYITITLSDDSVHKIPVVKNLICAIQKTDLADDGLLYLGYGASTIINVDVNIESGDIIRPVVPAEWKAEIITDYSDLTDSQTLDVEITAPMNASKCVVTIEVNRGANTITDEIVARTETKSYYDDYMAGLDIEIGGVIINKKIFKDAILITEDSEITKDKAYGLYFVESGKTLTYNVDGQSSKHMLVIGNNVSGEKPCFKLSKTFWVNMGSSPTKIDGYYVWSNVKFEVASTVSARHFLAYRSNEQDKMFVFNNCDMSLSNFDFFELKTNGRYFNSLSIENCRIKLNGNMFLVSLGDNTSDKFGKLQIRNNIFYSKDVNTVLNNFKLVNSSKTEAKFEKLLFNNNLFINILPTWSSMFYACSLSDLEMKYNILWANSKFSANFAVLRPNGTPTTFECDNNIGYSLKNDGDFCWLAAFGKISSWGENAIEVDNYYGEAYDSEESPLQSIDFDNGNFIVKSTYSSYGPNQD